MRLILELFGRELALTFHRNAADDAEPADPPGTTASQVETTGYDWWQDDKAVACFGLSPIKARRHG